MSRGTWTARFRIDPDLWERLGQHHDDRSGWLRERVEAEVNGNGAATEPTTESAATPGEGDGPTTWQQESRARAQQEEAAFGILSRLAYGHGGQRGAVIADLLTQLRDAADRRNWTPDRIFTDHPEQRQWPLQRTIEGFLRTLDGRATMGTAEARRLITNAATDAYGCAADQYHYLRDWDLKDAMRAIAEDKAIHDDQVSGVEPAKGTRQLVSQTAALLAELEHRDPRSYAHRLRKSDREAAHDELKNLPGDWAEEARDALEELDWS